jgi:hypothetical protein
MRPYLGSIDVGVGISRFESSYEIKMISSFLLLLSIQKKRKCGPVSSIGGPIT